MKDVNLATSTTTQEPQARAQIHKETAMKNPEAEVALVAEEHSGSRSWREMGWGKRVLSIIGLVFGFGDDLLSIMNASKIKPKKIQWLWTDRIPLGKLTLFVGNPDNGKSMAATYVAATVTSGAKWFNAENTLSPSDVLIFANEDDPEDTAVPRLMAAGADLQRVGFGRIFSDISGATEKEREMQLDKDIAIIKKTLEENPAIRLVIVDPVSNYLGATKMFDEQAVRRVLAPLNTLASETGVTILGVMHLNKKGDLKPINRVGGAMAFVGVARAVWLFGAEEKQNDLFYMLRLKNNIAERSGGLMYRIATKPVEIEGEEVPQPYIEWLGETEKSADSLLTPRPAGRPDDERQDGAEWLKRYLSEGPRPSTEVEAQCGAAGIKYRTLQRAKDDIGVKSVKRGEQWYWELPMEPRSPES